MLITALVEQLHQLFPIAGIDLLVRNGNERLFEGHPFLNQVLVWNKQEKYKSLWSLLRQIRANRYDAVINAQRFAATGFLAAFSGAPIRAGFDKNPWRRFFTHVARHSIEVAPDRHPPLHEIDRNQRLIAHWTDAPPPKPRLYPTKAHQEAVAGYQARPYITIAPTSVWFTKQYPASRFAELLRYLTDIRVFLLGAKSDLEACEAIARESGHPDIEVLAGKLNFLESVALIQGSRVHIANDSAPLHFASAVNTPQIAIFCSTVPAFGFYPLSDVSYIVEVETDLPCRPCGLHGKKACPEGHFRCAYDISVAHIAALAAKIISEGKA